MTNCFIIDLDNNLYEYEPANKVAHAAVVKSLSECLSRDPEEVKVALKAGRDLTHKLLHGQGCSHSREIYYHHALEALTGKSNPKLAHEHGDLFRNTFFDEMKLYDGVKECLEYIKNRNRRTAILTNLTQNVQFRKIQRLGIAEYFDYIVTSEEAGVEKPNPAAFHHTIYKLQGKHQNIDRLYMIGDSVKDDVEGAHAIGIPYSNIFLNQNTPPSGTEPFNVFNNWYQLKEMLKPEESAYK